MVNEVKEFEKKLEEHIRKIEARSHIELVPVIVKRASSYLAWSLVWGSVLSFTLLEVIRHYYWNLWASGWYWIDFPIFVGMGILFGWFLRATPFFSFFIPKALQKERCVLMAEALFASEQIYETSNRLGVLICIFEFEKVVLVFADSGFSTVVPATFWQELGAKLAADFDRHNPGEGFFAALEEIEAKILPEFASHPVKNPNELSDKLRKK